MNWRILLLCLIGFQQPLPAETSVSENYTLSVASLDSFGTRASSANYASIGSSAGIAGGASSANGKLRSGFAGQIAEAAGLAVTPAASSVGETQMLQLTAWRLLDDGTLLPIARNLITWSISSGPIAEVDPDGLATAKIVPSDTPATIAARVGSDSGSVTFTVADTIPDNFGNYGGDALSDDWQVLYFGENNAEAIPEKDADGDGQSNLAEYRSGYSPVDARSFFTTDDVGIGGGNFQLRLSRVQPGTRYVFEGSTDVKTWTEIAVFEPAVAAEPYVRALPMLGARGFYRVRLEAVEE